MANQIARNFEVMGHIDAVEATADHINMFWDPRMKSQIFADAGTDLSPIAKAAIEELQKGECPPHQTRATEFNSAHEIGQSDAG
ncbi:formate dehydrogenase [Altericroceibacterium spongiae]|uniref:Formate dehydrogenase n=2 Tax=Altericroceibacterium spongiae TaxID=2320269 RepID=A0A420EQ51_9SPHN|nr:formate dehydrogenase [Altericroceibacterium spongiae]